MKSKSIIIFVAAFFCFLSSSAIADTRFGTYEVSYIYNSLDGGSPNQNPLNILTYNGSITTPVFADLAPGDYYWKMVSGRETGNVAYSVIFNQRPPITLDNIWQTLGHPNNLRNPSVPSGDEPYSYQTGFNGGNTDPYNYIAPPGVDPSADLQSWGKGFYLWIGASMTTGGTISGLDFSVSDGQKAWLYWNDNWVDDNLGGVTVEIWQKSTQPVPEPVTMLLLGFGIIGLAGVRRFRE